MDLPGYWWKYVNSTEFHEAIVSVDDDGDFYIVTPDGLWRLREVKD
jgi:hypothetical protein